MANYVRTMKEGLIVGLIGYASVAILYAILDFLAARGFLYTVDLLGKAMFRGLNDPSVLALPIEVDMMAVFWYNGFHLLISLAIGLIIIGFVDLTERYPAQAQFVLFTFFIGYVITVVVVIFLTDSIRPLLPWWSIVVSNIIAIIPAGIYLIKKHPGIGPPLLYLFAKITVMPHKNKPSS